MSVTGGTSLRGLGRRVAETYRHLGLRTLLWRIVSFPVRFTPLRLPLGLGSETELHLYHAARWHRREGRPVAVVAPGARLDAPAGHDLLVLDDGLAPGADCLAALQYAAYREPGAAIAGGLVLAADGTVESAGMCRSVSTPDGVAERYAGRPGDRGAALVPALVLAPAAGCAYLTRGALSGLSAETTTLEDLALDGWEAGRRVVHVPAATARRQRGAPRPRPAPRALTRRLDERNVRTADGRLRIAYVTQATTVGGGHRDVFEHLNRLQARGHEVALYSLDGPPDWFALEAPVRSFDDWDALTAALAGEDAIKIATWWRSATPVWLASRRRGLPVYFVQDIETSYYPEAPTVQARVLATYRNEFRYITISGYNREGLAEMGLRAELIPPGIDLGTFRPLGRERREDMLLAIGRGNHLKNIGLTIDAWRALGRTPPELCLFGIEPDLGDKHGVRYVTAPSDEQVNELLNEATIFVQTSRHEGFALPPLEAMATGGAVVCTDAHGNRDFCRDGENCLMPEPTVESVAAAVQRLLGDPALRRRLGEEGIRTARDYAWELRIDALEASLLSVAPPSGH